MLISFPLFSLSQTKNILVHWLHARFNSCLRLHNSLDGDLSTWVYRIAHEIVLILTLDKHFLLDHPLAHSDNQRQHWIFSVNCQFPFYFYINSTVFSSQHAVSSYAKQFRPVPLRLGDWRERDFLTILAAASLIEWIFASSSCAFNDDFYTIFSNLRIASLSVSTPEGFERQ